jgi:hypothetical protein
MNRGGITMDFLAPIINSIGSLFENQFPILFQLIGVLVVLMSALDAIIPDSIDHGFFKELRDVPVLGKILDYFAGMSILRKYKD